MQPARLHPDRHRSEHVHDDLLSVVLIVIVLAALLFVVLATPAHGVFPAA